MQYLTHQVIPLLVFGTVFLGNCLPVHGEKGVNPAVLLTVHLREAKAIGRASNHVSFASAQILANVSFKDVLALST